MNYLGRLVGLLAVLCGGVGCDRLPSNGDEGEPCFGDRTCNGDLVCSAEHMVCCPLEGCQPLCGACTSGEYCDYDTCEPCTSPDHCGGDCVECTVHNFGTLCIERAQGRWSCGCEGDYDCGSWDFCYQDEKKCSACSHDHHCGEDCVDCSTTTKGPTCKWITELGGTDCVCSGTTPCEDGTFCEADACRTCDRDYLCGYQCLDCEGETDGSVCVFDANEDRYRCGCDSEADCPSGQTCVENSCQA